MESKIILAFISWVDDGLKPSFACNFFEQKRFKLLYVSSTH